MDHPLTLALLLAIGFNLGLLLGRLFGPPEAAASPEAGSVHDPVTRLLRPPAADIRLRRLSPRPPGSARRPPVA